MSEREPQGIASERVMMSAPLNIPTWRYVGDRDAADQAYCARFGVPTAPEPTVALGGALAYTVPTMERRT